MNIFGSSATALPGLIILRLYPKFLEETIGKFPDRIILVTGTNGKTTTAHLLVHLLRGTPRFPPLNIFHNPEGSNMERGIASAILKSISVGTGRDPSLRYDWCVIESDEGSFPKLLSILKPRTVILLNIFRDQLDRYGEINTLMGKWSAALQNYPPEKIIFNADDPNITWMVENFDRAIGFGVETLHATSLRKCTDSADRIFCPQCNNILNFSENNFYCEQCGFKKIKAEYTLSEFVETPSCASHLEFQGEPIGSPVIGKYNYYNLAAALTAYCSVGNGRDRSLQQLLSDFHPAFGRFEEIKYKNHWFHVILAKNPAGMDNVLNSIFSVGNGRDLFLPPTNLLMCLNDKIADGEDVSWIYDVDFERLFFPGVETLHATSLRLILSGTRAYDLALRLKIAEKLPENHLIELDMAIAFEKFLTGVEKGEKSYVIVTYTCLLELQKIMYKKGMIRKIM